ncbi:MAG: hypothetical protein F4091_00300 [Acidimicrobiales bacterium]|nr:hypothetical protein [Acidimicrobiales bacterium]MYD81802.1 hypothetical protein [Acidimicrobiales bacterium]MYJ63900.1 hypothetical protein [Acidimicrobiales bacterium]
MAPEHSSEYDTAATDRCERVLVTLLGDIGPWGDRVVLVGGLAPRYIVGLDSLSTSPHVGTTDVDLVITLAVGDSSETYTTLYRNLKRSGFTVGDRSYQWQRSVDGIKVEVEFICETDQTDPGAIYRPKQGTGSDFAAFNAPCAGFTSQDYVEAPVTAERFDGGGLSTVTLRVVGVLLFVVLKSLAFQQRHHNKDSYDLVYTLKNYEGGPRAAGEAAAQSPVRCEQSVAKALESLRERFGSPDNDAPVAYANFLADRDDHEHKARLRNEAVAVVRQFLAAAGRY